MHGVVYRDSDTGRIDVVRIGVYTAMAFDLDQADALARSLRGKRIAYHDAHRLGWVKDRVQQRKRTV